MNNIDKAFTELINKREIHLKLDVTSDVVRRLRYQVKNNINISTDTKLKHLQKSGWRQTDKIYNRADLVGLLNFYKKTSQAARDHGPEYVIEKWEAKK